MFLSKNLGLKPCPLAVAESSFTFFDLYFTTEYDFKTPNAILATKKGWLTIEQAPPKKIGAYSIDHPPEYRQVEITKKGEEEL